MVKTSDLTQSKHPNLIRVTVFQFYSPPKFCEWFANLENRRKNSTGKCLFSEEEEEKGERGEEEL